MMLITKEEALEQFPTVPTCLVVSLPYTRQRPGPSKGMEKGRYCLRSSVANLANSLAGSALEEEDVERLRKKIKESTKRYNEASHKIHNWDKKREALHIADLHRQTNHSILIDQMKKQGVNFYKIPKGHPAWLALAKTLGRPLSQSERDKLIHKGRMAQLDGQLNAPPSPHPRLYASSSRTIAHPSLRGRKAN
ncbi:hypothetical protein FRB90_011940 [Tulasnella sp. 427]|nr:hypothetical protein FRB90_011940 [Tulasnella sp. 427]